MSSVCWSHALWNSHWNCCRFGRLSCLKMREIFWCSFFLQGQTKSRFCKHCLLGITFILEILFLNGKYIYIYFFTLFPPVENGSFLLVVSVGHALYAWRIHLPIKALMYCATLLLVIYLQRSYSSWVIVYFISLILFSGDIVFEDSNVEFESARFD